jgi:uncharacterized protein YecE (DUF72 family)
MPKSETPERQGRVRAGVGGWIYKPWRGTFYPEGLKQADELAYATSRLTSIEINATHYRLQSAKSFRKWADTAPEGFVYSLKGPRLVTQQKMLAETGKFIERFIGSGLEELGEKLGPVLWQFAPFKTFDETDFGKFLELLPRELNGRTLNHVVEVRHASFQDPKFVRLLRDHHVSPVYVDSEDYPSMPDVTGDVVYARLQRGDDAIETGYPPKDLDAWAARAKIWASGGVPDDLPMVDAAHTPAAKPRDVFVYFIHEGKQRAPAAAMGLIERLD